jgi:hypothetical protein
MIIRKSKILAERELFFLQGHDTINQFLKNKIDFQISNLDDNFIPAVYEWVEQWCSQRVAIVVHETKKKSNKELTLYFEIAKDADTFLQVFSKMEDQNI